MKKVNLFFIFLIFVIAIIVAPAHSQSSQKKIAILLTSNSEIPSLPEEKTGYWGEELVVPYQAFLDQGYEVTLLSPKGGISPIDPRSITKEVTEFLKKHPAETTPISEWLKNNNKELFDAVFIVGGHGLIWDLADIRIKAGQDALRFLQLHLERIIAAVCHGPAVLVNLRYPEGRHGTDVYFINGRPVTAYSESEEDVTDQNYIPGIKKALENSILEGSLENAIQIGETLYEKGPDWKSYVRASGNLITGQNPASSLDTVQALIAQLEGHFVSPTGIVLDRSKKDSEIFRQHLNLIKENMTETITSGNTFGWGHFMFEPAVTYSIVGEIPDLSEGHNTFFIGTRKAGLDSLEYTNGMMHHVRQASRTFVPMGLIGYFVTVTRDYEMAVMQWENQAAMEKAFGTPEGKALVLEAQSLLEPLVWEPLANSHLGK